MATSEPKAFEYLPECGHCNPNARLLTARASEGQETVMRRAFMAEERDKDDMRGAEDGV